MLRHGAAEDTVRLHLWSRTGLGSMLRLLAVLLGTGAGIGVDAIQRPSQHVPSRLDAAIPESLTHRIEFLMVVIWLVWLLGCHCRLELELPILSTCTLRCVRRRLKLLILFLLLLLFFSLVFFFLFLFLFAASQLYSSSCLEAQHC